VNGEPVKGTEIALIVSMKLFKRLNFESGRRCPSLFSDGLASSLLYTKVYQWHYSFALNDAESYLYLEVEPGINPAHY